MIVKERNKDILALVRKLRCLTVYNTFSCVRKFWEILFLTKFCFPYTDVRSSGPSCSTNMSLAEQKSEMGVMSADRPDLTPRLQQGKGQRLKFNVTQKRKSVAFFPGPSPLKRKLQKPLKTRLHLRTFSLTLWYSRYHATPIGNNDKKITYFTWCVKFKKVGIS